MQTMSLPVPTEEPHFTVILRRQDFRLTRPFLHVLQIFLTHSSAGWGSSYKISLTKGDYEIGAAKIAEKRNEKILGQFLASALVMPVFGSVFYAFPAVLGVGGVHSPISLLTATLVLFIWHPIMEELGSALPMSGAPYVSASKHPLLQAPD
ncbi:hypothetical protein JOM56_004201 [Amanita muscaria]